MKSFSFEVDFGYGTKTSDSAVFSLELNEAEITFLKNYIKVNGQDCGYEGIESENAELFEMINDAANDAVVEEINRNSETEVDFFDIDWTGMSFDFIWPNELIE